VAKTEFYVNADTGFHSNDGRGNRLRPRLRQYARRSSFLLAIALVYVSETACRLEDPSL
jgi:hypothetical protein